MSADTAYDEGYDDGYRDGQANAEDTSEASQIAPLSSPSDGEDDEYYANCAAAEVAGAAPVNVGDPGYGSHLDRDGDGVGCE